MAVATSPRCWLGEGGPLRKLEARCRLTNPYRQTAVACLIAWVPLVVFGFATEAITGRRVGLLHDVAVHVRLLVALPVLLFLDQVFPRACRHAIEQLSLFGFIRPDQRPRFDRTLLKATHLGDWWVPEAVVALLALGIGIGALAGVLPIGEFIGIERTAVDYWYALVSLPLFEFLIFRSLWRWIIWLRFLVGLSRIDLDLDATHPDKRGGISFLRKPSLGYCAVVLFVVSTVLSAEWGSRFEYVTVLSFVPVLLVCAVVGVVFAFAPLLLFSLPLHRLRRESVALFGGATACAGRAFRDRWRVGPGDAIIASSEIQSLGALAATYRDTVNAIRIVPLEKRDLVTVLLATLAPIIPAMLDRVPHSEWVAILALLKGGML